MDEVISILEAMDLDADIETCDTLVDDGILESLDVVALISELSESFGIKIPAREIVPENFNSAEAIYEMVRRLLDE